MHFAVLIIASRICAMAYDVDPHVAWALLLEAAEGGRLSVVDLSLQGVRP
jgi:hypothetical protein